MIGNELIMAIKPEYTATLVAVYQHADLFFLKTIKHSDKELSSFKKLTDQHKFRSEKIMEEINKADIIIDLIKIVIGRGGMVKPVLSGVYKVNAKLMEDLKESPVGEHAVNLGGLIANDIAHILPDAKALIANPVSVDELDDIARYTGLPDVKRISIFHALNQKIVAHKHAKSILKKYEELNLIVAHLGEGISIGAHHKGKVVDVNQAFDGAGPFSLMRTGTLPLSRVINMCYSGDYTKEKILKIIRNEGGFYAYFGTMDIYEIGRMVEDGNQEVIKVLEAMVYQVAKYIGAMCTVLKGDVDAILLTGDLAHFKWLNNFIKERVTQIAPVHIYPGESVAEALAMNALMVLKGEVEAIEYK